MVLLSGDNVDNYKFGIYDCNVFWQYIYPASTYYDCWITLQTALKIAASNLYCKITWTPLWVWQSNKLLLSILIDLFRPFIMFIRSLVSEKLLLNSLLYWDANLLAISSLSFRPSTHELSYLLKPHILCTSLKKVYITVKHSLKQLINVWLVVFET